MTRQQLRFCRSRDGARIAIALLGKGPPLLRASHWLSHVELECHSPVTAPWIRELSRDHTYIRYDHRGCGLSDWTPPSFNLECWIEDLEAVVDTLGLTRFPLFGMSQGGAIAMAYAARHPERVSHLILLGAYARGRLRRAPTASQQEEAETLLKLIRVGWGRDNPAFRQFFTALFIPECTREQQQWFNDFERLSATPENAAAILETLYQIDVVDLAETLRVPTLICHARHDALVPFEEGRLLAAAIPSARFIPLESRNHVLLEEEPAWPVFLSAVREFLGTARELPGVLDGAGLTPSEIGVLKLVAQGLDNQAIATALAKSEKTVRNQVSAVFGKLGVKTRAEAVVRARDAEIGGPLG